MYANVLASKYSYSKTQNRKPYTRSNFKTMLERQVYRPRQRCFVLIAMLLLSSFVNGVIVVTSGGGSSFFRGAKWAKNGNKV